MPNRSASSLAHCCWTLPLFSKIICSKNSPMFVIVSVKFSNFASGYFVVGDGCVNCANKDSSIWLVSLNGSAVTWLDQDWLVISIGTPVLFLVLMHLISDPMFLCLQACLRLIAFNKIYKILDMEVLVPENRLLAGARKRSFNSTNEEGGKTLHTRC